jgi:hypothetical protein
MRERPWSLPGLPRLAHSDSEGDTREPRSLVVRCSSEIRLGAAWPSDPLTRSAGEARSGCGVRCVAWGDEPPLAPLRVDRLRVRALHTRSFATPNRGPCRLNAYFFFAPAPFASRVNLNTDSLDHLEPSSIDELIEGIRLR